MEDADSKNSGQYGACAVSGYRQDQGAGGIIYYPNAKENDPSKDLDDIAAEFDELWDGKHPEFYDVRKLFAECDTKELAKAEEAIKDAERYLGVDAGK